MITQTINLNMVPGSVYPVIHVSQYDNDSGALKFNLFNGSAFSVPAGSAVVINGTKPDGYGFSYSATYSGNVVTANVTQQMTAVAGEVKCELRITKNSDVIGTQNFTLMVEPAALDNNTVISDSDIPAIAAAADYAAAAAASAAEAASYETPLSTGVPVRVASGSIDDLTTPGFYYCVLSFVSDLPEGGNGDVWVYDAQGDGTRFLQVFRRSGTAGSNDNNIYIRGRNTNGDWGTWWKYGDTSYFLPYNNSVSVTNGIYAGHISSSQKLIAFLVPYPLFKGTSVSMSSLDVSIRHSLGGYPYVRSGTNGSTYTQLGSSKISIITNGTAARTNEISSFTAALIQGVGILITLNFSYAICLDSAGTAITNNIPVAVMCNLTATIS